MKLSMWYDMCEDLQDAIEKSQKLSRAFDMTTVVVCMEKHRLLRDLLATALAYQAHTIERLMGFEETEVRDLAEMYGLDLNDYRWPSE